MDPLGVSKKILAGASGAVGIAGLVGTIMGATYIVHCSRFADTIEKVQSCYAFGAAMAGVGAGVNGIRSGGVQEGLWTYNPYLRAPTATQKKAPPSEPAEPKA
jgi:hypothetical protein